MTTILQLSSTREKYPIVDRNGWRDGLHATGCIVRYSPAWDLLAGQGR